MAASNSSKFQPVTTPAPTFENLGPTWDILYYGVAGAAVLGFIFFVGCYCASLARRHRARGETEALYHQAGPININGYTTNPASEYPQTGVVVHQTSSQYPEGIVVQTGVSD